MSDPSLASKLQALNVAPQQQPQQQSPPGGMLPPAGYGHPRPPFPPMNGPPRGGFPPPPRHFAGQFQGQPHHPGMPMMPSGPPPPRPGMPMYGMHGGPPPPPHNYHPQFQPRGPPPPGYPMHQHQQPPPPRPQILKNPVQNPGVFSMQDRDFNSKGYQQLRINDSEYMTGRELAQLVRMQLTAVQSGDSFADDYYFVKFAEQRRRDTVTRTQQMQMAATSPPEVNAAQKAADRPATLLKEMTKLHKLGSAALGLAIGQGKKRVPLPSMRTNFTDRTVLRERKSDQATREWEAENKVLGHTTKANLKRPRELIQFLVEAKEKAGSENDNATAASFGNASWKLRADIETAADAVLDIEDMHRLLKARYATLPPPGSNVALTPENQRVQVQVEKLRTKQENLCNELGTLLGFSKYEKPADGEDAKEVTIDMQHLLSIIWLPKGRRVVCRAVSCLLAPHHIALMESFVQLLVYFCCTSAGEGEGADKENEKLDELCTTTFCREIESLTLSQLRSCLSVLLDAQSPESLRALMSAKGGADVIRTLMTCGQQLVEEEQGKPESERSSEMMDEWGTLFGKFLEMAEAGVAAKEPATQE